MTDTSAFAGDLKRIVSDKSDAGTFGRFDETPVTEMNADMKSAYDYTIKLRGMVPGPHKIYLSNRKLLRTIVPTGAYFQTESTLTKAEIEIVTNVIDSRWGAAYTNSEHEKIGVELGHLAPEKAAALIAGLPTSFDDDRQQVVTSSPRCWPRRGSCPSGCSAAPSTCWGTRASST
jgi:4-carboxymuconolactone decarboxylase